LPRGFPRIAASLGARTRAVALAAANNAAPGGAPEQSPTFEKAKQMNQPVAFFCVLQLAKSS